MLGGWILGQKNGVDSSEIKAKQSFCIVILNILQSIQKCPELIIREVGIEEDWVWRTLKNLNTNEDLYIPELHFESSFDGYSTCQVLVM